MPRKVIILLVAAGAVFLLVLGVSLFGPKTTTPDITPGVEIPTQDTQAVQAPTIPPLPRVSPNTSQPFSVVSAIPENDPEIKHLPIRQIAFYFSQNINPSDLKYTVSPNTRTEVSTQEGYPNVIVLSPYFAWTPGITTITIQTTTQSASGVQLSVPYTYRLNTGPLEHPGL